MHCLPYLAHRVRRSFAFVAKECAEQCRLLVECNKELVCELAERMYAANRYETREDRIRVLTVTADDLATIANHFSLSVLQVMPLWVDPITGRLSHNASASRGR